MKLTIHIGEGTGLDGGPFFAAEVVGYDSAELTVRHDEGQETTVSLADIERYLTEEIERNEPVSISGVPEEDSVGSVKLPFREGFLIEAGDIVAVPGEVDRFELQKAIDEHGSYLGPN